MDKGFLLEKRMREKGTSFGRLTIFHIFRNFSLLKALSILGQNPFQSCIRDPISQCEKYVLALTQADKVIRLAFMTLPTIQPEIVVHTTFEMFGSLSVGRSVGTTVKPFSNGPAGNRNPPIF